MDRADSCANLLDLCLTAQNLDACIFALNACGLSERLRLQILMRAAHCIYTETTSLCVWQEEESTPGSFTHACSSECFKRAFSRVARVHDVLRKKATSLKFLLHRVCTLCIEKKGEADPLTVRLREKLAGWEKCTRHLTEKLQRGFILECD